MNTPHTRKGDRPAGISKRLWKRVRADAIKRGAIILPGEQYDGAAHDPRDQQFHDAIERSRLCDERCLAVLEEMEGVSA